MLKHNLKFGICRYLIVKIHHHQKLVSDIQHICTGFLKYLSSRLRDRGNEPPLEKNWPNYISSPPPLSIWEIVDLPPVQLYFIGQVKIHCFHKHLSFCPWGVYATHPWVDTPRQTPPKTDPQGQTPPGRHPPGTATAADGTHLTGMHS